MDAESAALDVELDETISITAKCFILDKYGRVLLVHDRGDWRPNGKRSGYGPPGGIVKKNKSNGKQKETVDDIFQTILRLMAENGIVHSRENGFPISVPPKIPSRLAAIREVLEETGYLVEITGRPLVFDKKADHVDLLYPAKILTGTLKRVTAETDNAGWFWTDRLPEDTYENRRRHIAVAAGWGQVSQLISDGKTARNMGYIREETEEGDGTVLRTEAK